MKLNFRPKLFDTLHGYSRATFVGDLSAGGIGLQDGVEPKLIPPAAARPDQQLLAHQASPGQHQQRQQQPQRLPASQYRGAAEGPAAAQRADRVLREVY